MKTIPRLAALVLIAGCLRIDGTLVSVNPEMAAPPITGEDSKDQPLQLSDYRGKVVLLEFWKST